MAELFADLEHDLNRAALRVARRLIDTNDDGELSYDEFVEWWHLGEHRWAAIGYGSEAQQTALQDTVALFDAFMPTSGLVYGRGLRGLHTRLTQEGMTSKAVKEWAQDVSIDSFHSARLATSHDCTQFALCAGGQSRWKRSLPAGLCSVDEWSPGRERGQLSGRFGY